MNNVYTNDIADDICNGKRNLSYKDDTVCIYPQKNQITVFKKFIFLHPLRRAFRNDLSVHNVLHGKRYNRTSRHYSRFSCIVNQAFANRCCRVRLHCRTNSRIRFRDFLVKLNPRIFGGFFIQKVVWKNIFQPYREARLQPFCPCLKPLQV